jgi:uncharacterized protein
MYNRIVFPRFYKPLKNKSFFLFGPRGTGKTTWLKQRFPDAQRFDLLDSETARLFLSAPERLESRIVGKPGWIVIDEVQKVPGLLDEVHRLIEDRRLSFVLTGSSARKLRRGSANLLAGRAIQKFFYPLTAWELGKDFQLAKALEYGLLPSVWTEENARQYLATYVFTYLKEEVYAESLVRNLGNFSRFLEVMSYSQAAPLSLAATGRDVGVDSKVIANYLEVLEDLLLAVRLPVFTRRAKRRMTAHPKFFFFDSGVFRALRPRGPLDVNAEIDGAALETLFFQHLRALGEFTEWDQTLYFWKTADKKEVDFVSYGSLGLFAFEIKRSTVIRDQDLDALRTFGQDYPMAKRFVCYGGERESVRDGISILNFEEALRRLPEIFGVSIG